MKEAGWVPEPFLRGAENLTCPGIRCSDRPASSESLYLLLVLLKILRNSLRTSERTESVYIINTHRLITFRETIGVYCKICIKHKCTVRKNAEFRHRRTSGTYSYHWALRSKVDLRQTPYVYSFLYLTNMQSH